MAWLKHWGIDENDILQNIDNVKNIITSKFKEKSWCEEILVVKRKLRYYKEAINPNLEDQKYLSVVTSSRNKISITKIRTNSHELHSKIGPWFIPKTPWVERVCHVCESMNIEDENHFLLECLAYTHIRSEFHSIWYNANLYNLLTCQNYSELGKLLGKAFWVEEQDFKVNRVFSFLKCNKPKVVWNVNHHHNIININININIKYFIKKY